MKNNIHGRDDYVNKKIDLTATISNIRAGFRRLFWIPIVLAVLMGGLFFLNSWRQYVPQYTVEATFTVEVNYGQTYSQEYYNSAAANNMATVFPYLISSTQLSNMVAEKLELDGALPVALSASCLADTNMFTLTAVGSDAQLTYDALCATMEVYPRISDRIVGGTTMTLVDEPMVPAEPTNSSEGVNSAKKGVVIGLFMGILLVILYALTRSTVQDSRYISRRINTQCLGKIKQIKTKKHRNVRITLTTVDNDKVDYSFKEAFRVIRTRVMKKSHENDTYSIMVTSTFPGEGKTTCAINLAISIAETGKKVILADCDLRKNSIMEDLKITDVDKSIEDFIAGEAKLEDCMYYLEKENIYVVPSMAKMFDEASEVVGSDDMVKAVAKMKEEADYVIVDTSPMEMMADAITLSRAIDACVFVVRYNYGKSKYIMKAVKELAGSDNELLGYIFNGMEDYTREYGYGGKYSQYRNYGDRKQ